MTPTLFAHVESLLPLLAAEGVSDRTKLLISAIFVFVMAIFVGFEIIAKVPATLHTPLMSGSNAISGITIVGALVASYTESLAGLAPILAFIAIVMATINVVGGYIITDQMLRMFKRR